MKGREETQTVVNDARLPAALVTSGCGYIGSQLKRGLAEGFIRILNNIQRAGYKALIDLPEAGR